MPKSVTVTPSSSIASPPVSQSRARLKYEETLSGRYYENESRLSWGFEESPPIELSEDTTKSKRKKNGDGHTNDESGDSKMKSEEEEDDNKASADDEESSSEKKPDAKMRYKCKLCGQPKQNHRCPFQQSLARSIGIMVYPSVNAFTAAEPGSLATPLSEMNNFVDLKEGGSVSDDSPGRPTPERLRMLAGTSTQVTPESMRSSDLHSPSFSTPARAATGLSRTRGRTRTSSKKRTYAQVNGADDQSDLLFLDSMELKQEQFRVISQNRGSASEAYSYPPLPLPYAQRKRLSDNFFLCRMKSQS